MLKKVLYGLLGLVAVLAILIFTLVTIGGSKFSETPEIEPIAVAIPSDSAAIHRGERFAGMYGCTDCHGANLSGSIMIDAPPFLVVPSNLTITKAKSSEDWEKIIPHGITEDGRRAVIMPVYHDMPDQDMGDLIAYINSLEEIENNLPQTELRSIGKIIAVVDEYAVYEPRKMTHNHTVSIERVVSIETGANIAGNLCQHCHRPNFEGGKAYIPGSPDVPSLKRVANWDFAFFASVLKTGKLPDGRVMDPGHMPWKAFSHLTPEEVESIQMFIKSKVSESM